MKHLSPLLLLSLLATAPAARQESTGATSPFVLTVGDEAFATWQDYTSSPTFFELGLRCGTPGQTIPLTEAPSDCSLNSTTILPGYGPSNGLKRIPVVVHIIMSTSGAGNIPDSQVHNQIQILNEDFKAIAGSNGGNGTNGSIEFFLATTDPSGNPTSGITRSTNNNWFNDSGSYWNTLAWDTNRYLNIYTNQAGGALGYVPSLPQGGIVGSSADRVVILWSSFGLNSPIGPPYNKGRTTTHEVGHYFGLYHTFQGGCAPVNGCYTNGDRVCDTNAETQPRFGCPNATSCNTPDPTDNYMDYTDDLCMERFTPEQINRMRCTIENWRPNLPDQAICLAATVQTRNAGPNPNSYTATPAIVGQPTIFTVDTGTWSFATIFGVAQPANRPLDSGYFALIFVDSPLVFRLGPLTGPLAQTTHVVSADPSLCGITIYSQAKLHDSAPRPFALTNSQDLTIGI